MLRAVPPKVPEGGRFILKTGLNYGNPSTLPAVAGQRLRDVLRKVSA